MTPADLIRLVEEATPGPWRIGYWFDDKSGTAGGKHWIEDNWHYVSAENKTSITGNYDWEDGGVCSSEADARLIALAPALARICVEQHVALAAIREEFTSPSSESGYDGDPVELMAAGALSLLDGLGNP